MLGSSPNTSSPTGACTMASNIAGVGRVTVSLRRSIGFCGMGIEPVKINNYSNNMAGKAINLLEKPDIELVHSNHRELQKTKGYY
jgi:hypothetical protein